MDHEGATYKTLRDEIAMMALRALWNASNGTPWRKTQVGIDDACKKAYQWADAMLEARGKE
jgi:hypothetical protein